MSNLRLLTFEPGADWSLVPEHIREGIIDYVNSHREQGGFLMSVFRNDLRGAIGRADNFNILELREIVMFLNMNAPAPCWGSPEKVTAWLAAEERP